MSARRTLTSLALGSTLIAAAISIGGAPAQAASSSTRVVGHSYVNGNTTGTNTIAAYDRHADGSLTPEKGSPFAITGAGTGAGLGSQGAIEATRDGKYLLAVDAGSNQITVLRVTGSGVPKVVGAVPSRGVKPVSLTISDDGLVYVANVGDGGSNYTGFQLSDAGKLRPIAGSTIHVPEGSGVGEVAFNSTADRLIGTRDNTSLIDSFVVRDDGLLSPAQGSPFAAQSLGPIGAEFRPTNPSQLYVSNAHAGAGNGTVSAFGDAKTGVLTALSDATPDLQTAPCWVEISHDGKYLFTTNTASSNLSTYAIGKAGTLTLLGTTPFTNGTGAVDLRLSPKGDLLSVTGGKGHVLTTFSVDGPNLTELPSSPVALPAAGSPTGLVNL